MLNCELFVVLYHLLTMTLAFWQVTVEYKYIRGAAVPQRVHTVVLSVQHDENITLEQLRKDLREKVINAVIPANYMDNRTVFHLQPSGKFIIGGPQVI